MSLPTLVQRIAALRGYDWKCVGGNGATSPETHYRIAAMEQDGSQIIALSTDHSFSYCGDAAHFSQHFMCLPPSTHPQAS